MSSDTDIKQSLENLSLPFLGRSLGSLNMLHSVSVEDDSATVVMRTPGLNQTVGKALNLQIGQAINNLDAKVRFEIRYEEAKPAELNCVKHVIAVMSGKGGVGKSLVSALTAMGLRRSGASVGILDGDITGPSIPRMFGLTQKPLGFETGLLPVSTKSGISVMSLNLVLENEADAVIWRGPLIGRAVKQFWEEVLWGNLDYLIVDLPPGTADAPLTVIQSLPVSGLIIVTTPQELASMIVKKAVSMARQTDTRILGLVENMSYLYLPEMERTIEVFGPSHAAEMARDIGAPLLAQIPIDPELAALCDGGRIEDYHTQAVQQLAAVADMLSLAPEEEKQA